MTNGPINLPALFAQMGDWKYYSTIMRLADIKGRISFAEKIGEVRPGKQLSDLIQRALVEGRAPEIGNYLIGNKDRFFNSLVVAIYGGEPTWLEFDVSPTAPQPLTGDVPDWAAHAFGFLHLSGEETMFAVDGQHRLAGIINAVARKPQLGDDRVSVIIVAHKATDLGRRRTRKLFTTLNRSAIPVNKSEIIALDESDTAAIITRRLVEEHRFFNNGQVLSRYGAANLSATDSEHFITIIKLYDLVGYVIGRVLNRFGRDQLVRMKYLRPNDADLDHYYAGTAAFFEALINAMPELKAYFAVTGAKAHAVLKQERHENLNVLYRSVGLEIFVRLLNYIQQDEGGWKKAIAAAALLPRSFTDVPFRDVLYDTSAERLVLGRTRLTTSLLLHMLDYEQIDKVLLRERYATILGKDASDTRLPRRIKR
jgi:DNA sulfur modification protein DndB